MSDFERAPYPEHPDRCSQVIKNQGQCLNLGYKKPDGSRAGRCLAHGGNLEVHNERQKQLSNYRLTKWQARLQEKSSSDHIKSLRDEVGVLRMVLEDRLNQCQDNMDLILHSQAISDLVIKIEKVVTSCHKLEGSMGQLLDKQAVLQFAQIVISIITDVLTDEQAIDAIASRILQTVSAIGTDE